MNLATLEFHELANLFPMMSDKETEELATDIKEHNLLEPIVLLDGRILDGRNRYRALQMLQQSLQASEVIQFEEVYDGADPVAFVFTKNLHRRHLTKDQRAALAAESLKRLPKQKTGPKIISGQKSPETPDRDERLEKAAQAARVSASAVKEAAAVMNADPVAHKEVVAGRVTAKQARRQVSNQKARKAEKEVSDLQMYEAEQHIQKICGVPFWNALKDRKIAGLKTRTEKVSFAHRPEAEMRALSGIAYHAEISISEAEHFYKHRLDAHVSKDWRADEFQALMGAEDSFEGHYMTPRGVHYEFELRRVTDQDIKARQQKVAASKS